jgi:hypothetical protein
MSALIHQQPDYARVIVHALRKVLERPVPASVMAATSAVDPALMFDQAIMEFFRQFGG